jgi:hypothetical protein
VNVGNGDLLASSYNSLNRWKNYFSQLLNVQNVSNNWKVEVHTPEPLVPCSSRLEVKIVIRNLKKNYKSLIIDEIPLELIQEGGETLLSAK